MPIMLDDIASASIAPKKNTYSPTYFDRELTGGLTKAGIPRKSGVLGLEADPNQVKPGVRKLLPADIDVAHTVVKNAGTTSRQLPIDLIPKSVWDVIEKVEVPDDLDAAIHLADRLDGCGQVALSAYLKLEMHSIVLDIEPKNGRSLRQVWRCEVWFVDEDARRNRPRVKKISLHSLFNAMYLPSASTLAMGFAADVSGVLQKTVTMFINAPGWSVDVNDVFDQYSNVHTYNAVSRAANVWQTAIDKRLIFAVDHIMQPANGFASDYQSRAISQLMHRLEGYPVSLAFYRPIYDHLQQTLPADMMSEIVKTNLNLLLTDTMTKLDSVKLNLTRCPVRPGVTADPFFNREQAAAIESHDPLIMIQSVAGSGKSSTIRGRIQFMIDSGVEPHDITVLSFTNAAADHIKDICPGVNSMTISSMVHTIYSENFDHELSSIPTLCNTLDIYYPMNGLATTFKRYLKNTLECEPDAFTRLNTFVENNYDAIVDMLDTCRQTTLELEIIMCYQHIGQYKEPAAVASRHLIVDEVQDNSIFDFIYTLEYCVKHLESLYIVGDASQTLFEFRAANPRALNIMESSGVFTTYKLQINYRSNQSILDFANVMLDDIEANQFAHLRLQSNDLAPVTSASLAEKVRMQSVRVKNAAELRAIGPNLARVYLKPYIDECLARGEHVCVLGHTRMEVNAFTEALQELYPSRTVENISPSRTYDTTILSRYISRDWNQIRLFDRDKLVGQLVHYLTDNADTYVYPRSKPAIEAAKRMVLKWAGAASEVVKQWSYAVDAHRMGENEFYEKVKDHMLDFEIRANAQNKNVASQKNRQRRESIDFSAIDIVTSTIHSAKGLEFDNVVVLYHDLEGPGEDDKRMYYVALTRAMNTEFILAWSPRETKVIQEAYDNLLAGFQEQEDAMAIAEESGCEA